MQDEVSKAISEIKEQIAELENQITFINSIDFSKPITEDEWHKLCLTPLRSSDLLGLIVKNIFPEAEDINVHCNYVYFTLLGFEVQIPTSMCRGINVKTDWYIKDNGKPVLKYSPIVERMKEYFELVDNKAGWYECAKVRLTYGKSCKKWILFIAWWFRYKWKNPHRDIYEKKIEQEENDYKDRVKRYYRQRTAVKNKTEKLFNELIPMIDKFSPNHYKYNSGYGGYEIEDIRKFENL